MPTALATRAAGYHILAAALPGRPEENIGVVLHDPATGRISVKLRRDWNSVAGDEIAYFEALGEDLTQRAADMGADDFLAWIEGSLSNAIRVSDRQSALVASGPAGFDHGFDHGFNQTLRALYLRHVDAKVLPFRTHLPVYTCRAAAGRWGEQQDVEEDGWVEAPDDLRLTPDMFVAQVVGRSMEPLIPDGSFCVFRAGVVGSRQGKRLLIENRSQPESGQRYTVKRYTSVKRAARDGGEWEHARIRLEPLNPEFEAWDVAEDSECHVIGEFIRVLE